MAAIATRDRGTAARQQRCFPVDFDRRFYTALHVRFEGNLSQIAKAAGKQRVTVRAALRAIGLYDDTESTSKRK
jgi:hypothetical protein